MGSDDGRIVLTWILGASWSGKRTFISRCAAGLGPIRGRPAWMDETFPKSADELLREVGAGPGLVRWQWRREETLEAIANGWSSVLQEIVVLECDPAEHLARAAIRGDGVPTRELIAKEREDVRELARSLAMRHGLWVSYVRT